MSQDLQIRATTFLTRALAKYKNFYDYSKVQYKNSSTPVEIVCPIHGSFSQMPATHLKSTHGCPTCAAVAEATTQTAFKTAARMRRVHHTLLRGHVEDATFIFLDLVQELDDLKAILQKYIRTRRPDETP